MELMIDAVDDGKKARTYDGPAWSLYTFPSHYSRIFSVIVFLATSLSCWSCFGRAPIPRLASDSIGHHIGEAGPAE